MNELRLDAALPLLQSVLHDNSFPTAIPKELWPTPGLIEGCESGYDGTMCSACESGFTAVDGSLCRRCEDKSVVITAAVFVCLLLLLVVLGLTFNAVLSKGQTTVSVAAAKVLFSHLQTVAIALRLPFQFPGFLRELFEGMNSVSSVNTDVLRLDCMLAGGSGDGRAVEQVTSDVGVALPMDSRFIARSIVTLCIPLMLVAVAAVFWSVWPCVRAACCAPCAYAVLAMERKSRSHSATSPSIRQKSFRGIGRLPASTPSIGGPSDALHSDDKISAVDSKVSLSQSTRQASPRLSAYPGVQNAPFDEKSTVSPLLAVSQR